MKELSIFIDESGDFGGLSQHSPYYIISMVFHDQSEDLSETISRFNYELSYLSINNNCVHTGPIIRNENIYKGMDIKERKRILNKMMAFFRKINITYRCFIAIKENEVNDNVIYETLIAQITNFLETHYDYFQSFNIIKIYYDNGQNQVKNILTTAFSAIIPHPVYIKVMPKDYRLFQAADLICTLELLKLKMNNNSLSHSEKIFFGSNKDLKKNYIKYLSAKEMQ